jgi:hypothetical protein
MPLLLRALLSGPLSFASVELFNANPILTTLLPGLCFGALVLAPAAPSHPRRVAAVLLSALAYFAAVKLAVYEVTSLRVPEPLAVTLSGLFGALALAAVTRFVLRLPMPLPRAATAALLGAALGFLFSTKLPGAGKLLESLHAATLFTLWQTTVAVALLRKNRL